MWDTVIVEPMINALLFIYGVLGNNFGLAIIVFTLVVRLITHPFTVRQLKSTAAMQDLQKTKKWQDMQKKYKNDRQKLAEKQMEFYREAGVSPFGSCLPTLLQFPIILGLYQAIIRALASTPIQLIQFSKHIYPVFPSLSDLIPLQSRFLWMDLAQPERLVLPVINFGIPMLAIIVFITGYVQAKLMTPATTPGDQGAMMGQMTSIYFPLITAYFAFSFASGLALYFVASNVFTVLQYAALGRIDWRNLLPEPLKARFPEKESTAK